MDTLLLLNVTFVSPDKSGQKTNKSEYKILCNCNQHEKMGISFLGTNSDPFINPTADLVWPAGPNIPPAP